jgi:hypothetical protein
LPQASYILVRRLSIDRRSCGALMGGPAPISKSGGGIPTRWMPWAKARPAARGWASK